MRYFNKERIIYIENDYIILILTPGIVLTKHYVWYSPGHGLYGESEFGKVNIDGSEFFNNSGAGVRVKFVDTRYIEYDDRQKFCQRPDLAYQSFPQLIVGDPEYNAVSGSCHKVKKIVE